MRDFEYVLSLARAFAPSEEAAHAREREEPDAMTAVPRPKNPRSAVPDEHLPLPTAACSRG
jgi:hypothetical protein